MQIACDMCGGELTEFGGLLFSPPVVRDLAHKTHLCIECYRIVRDFVVTHALDA